MFHKKRRDVAMNRALVLYIDNGGSTKKKVIDYT